MAKTDVLLERMENLLEKVTEQHIENRSAHDAMVKRLDYTNGKVRNLQIWKGTLVGAFSVMVFLVSYFLSDYIKNKESVAKHEKDDALIELRVAKLEKADKTN